MIFSRIGAEGGEDSCGSTGQGRPRRRNCAEEAPRHARGKRSRLERKSLPRLTLPKCLERIGQGIPSSKRNERKEKERCL